MRKLAVLSLLLATVALAAPNPLVASIQADAQGDTVRPVVLTVNMENRGTEPSAPGRVIVTLTPKVSPSLKSKSGDTLFDPMTLTQEVPALAPNQKLPVQLNTPYQSRNSFRGQRGTCRVSNIDPTGGDVVVSFSAQFIPAPAQR